jgi:hypothetical protein
LLQALSDAPAAATSKIPSSVRTITIRMRATPLAASGTGQQTLLSLFGSGADGGARDDEGHRHPEVTAAGAAAAAAGGLAH